MKYVNTIQVRVSTFWMNKLNWETNRKIKYILNEKIRFLDNSQGYHFRELKCLTL